MPMPDFTEADRAWLQAHFTSASWGDHSSTWYAMRVGAAREEMQKRYPKGVVDFHFVEMGLSTGRGTQQGPEQQVIDPLTLGSPKERLLEAHRQRLRMMGRTVPPAPR